MRQWWAHSHTRYACAAAALANGRGAFTVISGWPKWAVVADLRLFRLLVLLKFDIERLQRDLHTPVRQPLQLCPLRVSIAAGGVEATALHCAHCDAMRPDCFAAERRAYRGSVRGCRDAPVCSVRTSAIGRLAPRWPAQPSLP
jgi:hypothetical protein